MYRAAALLALAGSLRSARAQQVGTNTAEVHPKLQVSQCTASGCTTTTQSIVIDANWRWVHSTSGYTNCYSGQTWDASLCPDDVTCAANCALDGADYSGTYGITTSGNAVTLQFITSGSSKNIGSRIYLMDSSDKNYQTFSLLNKEFTFDVDVSNLPCGLNGALYFSNMASDGGLSEYPTNKAGAKYGTGYCDAQCPQDLKFINGAANVAGWSGSSTDSNAGTGQYGACCSEMDIWESNKYATAYTPHPCTVGTGPYKCTGAECGNADGTRYESVCDKDGCDFNSWRMGNQTFLGPGLTIDTSKKVTVVTQFVTNDGTSTGTLSAIKRFYVQNGVTFANSYSNVAGIDTTNDVTDAFCAQQKTVFNNTNAFATAGGLTKMGTAMQQMVLVMSLWDDHAANCLWLDSDYPTTADPTAPGVSRGPCATTSGNPPDVESQYPGATITYSNIKWGDLGSTFSLGSAGSGSPPPPKSSSTGGTKPTSSSTSVKPPPTSSSTTTVPPKPTTTTVPPKSTTTTTRPAPTTTTVSSGGGGTAPHWGQCGGQGYTGPTTCASPYKCTYSNAYYSQCL